MGACVSQPEQGTVIRPSQTDDSEEEVRRVSMYPQALWSTLTGAVRVQTL